MPITASDWPRLCYTSSEIAPTASARCVGNVSSAWGEGRGSTCVLREIDDLRTPLEVVGVEAARQAGHAHG
eukprot:2277178-Rhodomonas_salina.1